jgi:hypothetical protein
MQILSLKLKPNEPFKQKKTNNHYVYESYKLRQSVAIISTVHIKFKALTMISVHLDFTLLSIIITSREIFSRDYTKLLGNDNILCAAIDFLQKKL